MDTFVMKKRERSSNFTENETSHLMTYVLQEIEVIENKKTNSVSIRDKQAAWQRVCNQFNRDNTIVREVSSIKAKYDNIKRILKKKLRNLKNIQNEIDDGMQSEIILTWYEEELYKILQLSVDEDMHFEANGDGEVSNNSVKIEFSESNTIDGIPTVLHRSKDEVWDQESRQTDSSSINPSSSSPSMVFPDPVPITMTESTHVEKRESLHSRRKGQLKRRVITVGDKQNSVGSFPFLPRTRFDLVEVQKRCYLEQLKLERKKQEVKEEKWDIKKQILEEELKLKQFQVQQVEEERRQSKELFDLKLQQEAVKLEILKCELKDKFNQNGNLNK